MFARVFFTAIHNVLWIFMIMWSRAKHRLCATIAIMVIVVAWKLMKKLTLIIHVCWNDEWCRTKEIKVYLLCQKGYISKSWQRKCLSPLEIWDCHSIHIQQLLLYSSPWHSLSPFSQICQQTPVKTWTEMTIIYNTFINPGLNTFY